MFEHRSKKLPLPNYLKYLIILSSLVLTGYVLILGRSIVNPLITAFILALILKPLSSWLERFHIPRALSSLLSILVIFIVLAGLTMFFSGQINNITDDFDSIGNRLNVLIDKAHHWAEDVFGVAPEKQTEYLKQSLSNFLKNSSSFFGSTISATAGFFSGFFFFLISLFFILYYRSFFVSFLFRVFKDDNHLQLHVTLHRIEKVVRKYILGLFLVITIIATLNTVGLMLLGIEHAIFFGALAAVLTIIPYVGILIGSLLPMIFALVTKDSLWYPIGVALIFWFVQFLEGNFITPNIVGDQVSINPFAAILALFFGGLLLGAIGMIFAIPLLAIIKVICESIDPLKPLSYLIGNPPDDVNRKYRNRERLQAFIKLNTSKKN